MGMTMVNLTVVVASVGRPVTGLYLRRLAHQTMKQMHPQALAEDSN